ncbi:addiction module protein [Ventosimonas gracilis]|uniref:Addiction module protein n=1 Tax=Ventosimonas gracilis TaxID=1680762 RepID=A0A139SJT8_9GAMM|nr:type II toxin-antitoxin system VapC family toxin [Ventosimonas gracilis]KXU34842.1 addiction module protein [Ventosimonas gracilis]
MLDTNICIYIAKRQPPEVIGRFAEYRRGEIAISAITWGELFCATDKDGAAAINGLLELLEVVPFCRKAAEHYALLTMQHPNRKANFDRLIAAHAIALDVPLVSNNLADFTLYESSGLQVENWIDPN